MDPVKPYLQLIACAVVLALLVAIFVWGDRVGSARVQDKWDNEKVRQLDAVNFANQRAQQYETDAKAANARIRDELAPQLAAADANGRDLANRLRIALQATSSPGVSQAPGVGQSADSGGESDSTPQLEAAVANAFGACSRDAARLDALIAEIKPQL